MCLITQYFTMNINILHVVYVCIKWKRALAMRYVHDKKKQKNYCLHSKEIDG